MANQRKKGRKQLIFRPEDWAWLHLHKERFPTQRKSKLHLRGDGLFQVIARVNNNAYKFDLLGEYNISITFNVSDLLPFDFEGKDSRANPFQERETDAYGNGDTTPNLNPLSYGGEPIIRLRAERMKEAIIGLIQENLEHRGQDGSNLLETKLINLVSCVQDDTRPCNILHARVSSIQNSQQDTRVTDIPVFKELKMSRRIHGKRHTRASDYVIFCLRIIIEICLCMCKVRLIPSCVIVCQFFITPICPYLI